MNYNSPDRQQPDHQQEETLPTKPEDRLEMQPWMLIRDAQLMMQPMSHRKLQQ
jgi:hypothetical protein